MTELSKQERHIREIRGKYDERYFDKDANEKRECLFKFIGEEWREIIKEMIVLDVGCGPVPLRIGAKREIGLDPLIEKIIELKFPEKHYDCMELINGFASKIDLENESVDFIHCRMVIEYVKDWNESLKEMRRVLKKGGHMAIFYHDFQTDETNLNLLFGVDMAKYLRFIGFEVIKHEKEGNFVMVFAKKRGE